MLSFRILFVLWYVITTMIESSLSAIFMTFDDPVNYLQHYSEYRKNSVYRGLILSFSEARKREVCRDIFHSQFNLGPSGENYSSSKRNVESAEMRLYESTSTLERPGYPIMVRRLTLTGQPLADEPEIFFECDGKVSKAMGSTAVTYFISYGYEPNVLHASQTVVDDESRFELAYHISLTPEYVPFEHEQLEEYYISIRRKIKALQNEFPELIEEIHEYDDISNLSRAVKFQLCASILTTPTYRQEKLEFSMEWPEITDDSMAYSKKLLQFTSTKFVDEKCMTDCIVCEGIHNLTFDSTNLYITRSYDDKNSVFVLKKVGSRILLDKYFKHIPTLM